MQLDATTLTNTLTWPALIDALNDIFTQEVTSPVRHHHTISVPEEPEATLLLMPAWIEGRYLGVKQVSVFPGNNAKGIPGLTSLYTLSCGLTGKMLAQMDGNELTARRTAAASALASRYLSRPDTASMLMVGAGRMGRKLIPAHCSVRPIDQVWVWDRNQDAAKALVDDLNQQSLTAHLVKDCDLPNIAGAVDLISCATMAQQPVILGEWLRSGTHLDLVGSFTPTMREVDDNTMKKAAIFVDTRAGALAETGDLIMPIRDGVISEQDIQAELTELCGARHAGRTALPESNQAITLFKSVGDSREDLAAAILAYEANL